MGSKDLRMQVVICLVSALSCRGWAQGMTSTLEKPQFIKLRTIDSSLIVEAEQRNEKTSADDGSRTVNEDSLWISPLLKLNIGGSIFHPNLLEFSFDGEFGMNWEKGEVGVVEPPSAGSTTDRDITTVLQRYDAQLTLLKQKDYAMVFSAGHAVSRRDYDFFKRVTVNADHYGVNWALRDKEWPVSVSLSHRLEDIDDIERPETDENSRMLLTLRNQRSTHDMSDARYSLEQYRYERGYYPEQHGINHSFQFLDVQTFGNLSYTPQSGSRLQSRLDINDRTAVFELSTNSASQSESTSSDFRRLAVMEELKLQHSDDLSSFYNYNFAYNGTEQVKSMQHQASMGLRHRLYDILESSADIHGRTSSNSGEDSEDKTRMIGAVANAAYTRKLGTWGRLTLGGGFGVDSESRDSSGGFISIVNEAYSLASGQLVVLRHPNVVSSSITVTDGSGTIRYVESFDYVIVPHGQLTEIRRVVGGHIPDGASVMIAYDAASEPSGQFVTSLNNINCRLDLADNLVGIYGRHNGVSHSGGEDILLEDINNNVVGIDMKIDGFRVGIEAQQMDSNLLPYNSLHSFQQLNFEPVSGCSLGIDFDQMAITYTDTDEEQNMYSYIVNCRMNVAARCSIDLSGGLRQERGPVFDRDTVLARAELELGVGRMNVRMGYELQDEKDSVEDRTRILGYLRASRQF